MIFHGAYGVLKVKRTAFAFSFLACAIDSQPDLPASSHRGFTIVLHVKIRSSALTGFPSLQRAFLFRVTSRTIGRLFTSFPRPMYGRAVKSG